MKSLAHAWLAGCFAVAPVATRAESSLQHVVVQLPFTHQFQFAGYYAAQYRGYYAAEGLDVELRPNLRNGPSLSEVTEGRAEYGVFQGAGLMTRWMKARDVVVLAAVMQHSPFAVAVRADSDLHGPKDLLHCRFALDSTRLAVEVKMMLEQEGLDFSKLNLVPNRWGVDELGAGTADAMDVFITNRPEDMSLNRGEAWRLIQPRDYGVDFYGDCLFGRREYVFEHPAEAAALRRASMRGWEYALEHPAELEEWILTKLPGRPAGLTRESLDYEAKGIAGLVDAQFVEIGHINPGRWAVMAEGIHRFVPSLPDSDLDGFIFTPNETGPLPVWVRWLIWILGLSTASFILALYANRRLRRLVEKRATDLRASEERMRNFVENANVGIYRSTPDGRILFANNALIRMMGYDSIEALAARNLEQDGYEPTYPRRAFKEMIERDGVVNGLEAAWKKRDGTVIFVRESAHVVRDGSGRPEYYDGIVEDISQRKHTEVALRESEERFRNLTAAAFEGIVISENGQILDVNDQTLRLVACSREELIGHSMLEFTAPESREIAGTNIRENRETGYQLTLLRRDGSRFRVECQVKMMRTGDRMLRMTAFRDITEQLQAEQRQRSLEEQLRQKQKMEAVGTLAGGIAHDFNNILTGILGNLELAQMDLPAGHPAAAVVAAARKASVRARELVARILAFSRLEGDHRAPAPLAPIVQEALQLLSVGLPGTVTIRTEFTDPCPQVSCDPSQIHQIIMNLGTNALHALESKSGVIVVELSPVQPDAALRERHPQVRADHTVCLTFRDNGCGMEPAVLERIFEPFYTTKSFGEGTGLGLSTLHTIMTNHHGAVVVESTPGSGTTFSLYFPATTGSVESPPRVVPRVGIAPPFGGGRQILLVDDEDFVREVNAKLLTRLGFTPLAFARGADALAAFTAAPTSVDAVVTDLAMPGMTGMELSRRILGLRADTPIILSSGHFSTEAMDEARGLGIRCFVHKPFDVQELVSQLKVVLESSGAVSGAAGG